MAIASGSQAYAADVNALQAASGNYTGDNTVNRVIPHGLPAAPKIVLIVQSDGDYAFRITTGLAAINWQYAGGSTSGSHVVTAIDITNFYVGNAVNYGRSANGNTIPYYWVAIL